MDKSFQNFIESKTTENSTWYKKKKASKQTHTKVAKLIVIKLMKTKNKENLKFPEFEKGAYYIYRKKYKLPVTSQQKHWRPNHSRMTSLKCQMETMNCQPSILHGAETIFRNKGEIKAFSEEQKQR